MQKFSIEWAKLHGGKPDATSTHAEHPYGSIEYFLEEYIELTVGFSSTHPTRSEAWLNNYLGDMLDFLGPEVFLHFMACLEAVGDSDEAAAAEAKFQAEVAAHDAAVLAWCDDKSQPYPALNLDDYHDDICDNFDQIVEEVRAFANELVAPTVALA